MVELRGREVRMSKADSPNNQLRVKSGSAVIMQGGDFERASDTETFRINNEAILRYLKLNDVAHFDDGKVVGIVKGINDLGVELEIKIGGTMNGNCGIRFVNGKHA